LPSRDSRNEDISAPGHRGGGGQEKLQEEQDKVNRRRRRRFTLRWARQKWKLPSLDKELTNQGSEVAFAPKLRFGKSPLRKAIGRSTAMEKGAATNDILPLLVYTETFPSSFAIRFSFFVFRFMLHLAQDALAAA